MRTGELRLNTTRLIIVTHPNGFFGRRRYGWQSINVTKLEQHLGASFETTIVPIDRLLDLQLDTDVLVLYGSSDDPKLRAFYKDVLFIAGQKCHLLPKLEHLFAHENKGFQELYKRSIGVQSLKAEYLFEWDQLRLPMPFVFKTIEGAGSAGVTLVSSERKLRQIRRQFFSPSFLRRAITKVRRMRMTDDQRAMYTYRHQGRCLAVAQEFVPGLTCDYKVLVYGRKYYLLRRSTRKDDFRASGSGIFTFPLEPRTEVLDFARYQARSLDAPYLSLDIAQREDGQCALIEYQVLHFGPYTILNSSGYFERTSSEWRFVKETPCLEREMAQSITQYVAQKRHAAPNR